MFLKKINRFFAKTSYRLGFVYVCFFVPFYLLTFSICYYVTADYLEKRDRDVIEVRLQQFEQLFNSDATENFKEKIINSKFRNQFEHFLIYVSDPTGHTFFLHLPEDQDRGKFDLLTVDKFLQNKIKNKTDYWSNIPSKDGDEDAIELKSMYLPNGFQLSVGASTDERDEILEKLRQIFFIILVPLLFISGFGSIIIAQKILRPLQNLATAISEIKSGRLFSRVPLPLIKDELFDLSQTFNEMAGQVENLVIAIKDTVDNIAHDLKTPLTRMRISSEMALQKNTQPDLQEAAVECIENCDSMLLMVQSVLEMAQLNAKTANLNRSDFDISKLVNEVVDLYFFVAEEKYIKIEVNVPSLNLFADRLRIKQVLANLLDNAIKYSGLNTIVKITADEAEQNIVFVVSDHGVGISQHDIPRIWERLFRADKSRHEPGLGLGLSLVKAYVEAHGGRVSVYSDINQGSEFEIKIPKVQSISIL